MRIPLGPPHTGGRHVASHTGSGRRAMSSGQRGNPAAMPGPGYSRPAQVHASGLIVTHVTEDGLSTTTFDFSEVEGPPELLKSLVQGFAVQQARPGNGSPQLQPRRVLGSSGALYATYSEQDNAPTSIEELGPEVWWTFRASIESKNRWPGVIDRTRVLLADTPRAPRPDATSAASPHPQAEEQALRCVQQGRVSRIRVAASQMVRRGPTRIDFNLAPLLPIGQATSPPTLQPYAFMARSGLPDDSSSAWQGLGPHRRVPRGQEGAENRAACST